MPTTPPDAEAPLVLRLVGHLDLTAERRYDEQVMIPESTTAQVVVDLADVDYVDSTGLRVLLRLRRRATELAAPFEVRNARGSVLHLIELTGLTDHFGMR